MIRSVQDEAHCAGTERIYNVRQYLRIGTADIKDLLPAAVEPVGEEKGVYTTVSRF